MSVARLADELGERWSLLPEDLALLTGRVDARLEDIADPLVAA